MPRSPPSPRLELVPITDPARVQSLKRLNSLLLPINYPESFYATILSSPSRQLARLALFDNVPVGGVRARWEPLGSERGGPVKSVSITTTATTNENGETAGAQPPGEVSTGGGRIYVMTLCVLSPFRRLGVGCALIQALKEVAREWRVDEICAHVWEANEDSLDWYARRGFTVEPVLLQGYYRKLKPGGAKVVSFQVPSEGEVLEGTGGKVGVQESLERQKKHAELDENGDSEEEDIKEPDKKRKRMAEAGADDQVLEELQVNS